MDTFEFHSRGEFPPGLHCSLIARAILPTAGSRVVHLVVLASPAWNADLFLTGQNARPLDDSGQAAGLSVLAGKELVVIQNNPTHLPCLLRMCRVAYPMCQVAVKCNSEAQRAQHLAGWRHKWQCLGGSCQSLQG